MHLKIRHLEVFDALFDAGSVSAAAERLNLSQPAVSVALGKFEEELGFRLFHRDRGYFAPTNEALLLREDVQRGITALDRVERRAGEIRSGAAGGISIASNGMLAYNFLPQAIAEFQRDFPNTHIELRIHSSRRIASWVGNGQIDIGFIDTPVPVAGLNAKIIRMECVCVMRESDPLAARDVITPQDIAPRAMTLITGDHYVDRQLADIMSQDGLSLNHTNTGYFYAIMRNLVIAGGTLALLDPINGKASLKDGLTWRPFRPHVFHDLAIITNRTRPLALSTKNFLDQITAHLAALHHQKDTSDIGRNDSEKSA